MEDKLEMHIQEDKEIQTRILNEITLIRENHLRHIEPDVASIKTNVKILMSVVGAIGIAIVGEFIHTLWMWHGIIK